MKNTLILCLCFIILGCGSRKKALDKSSEKTKTETVKEVDSTVQKDVEKESTTTVNNTVIQSDRDQNIELETANPDLPVTRTEQETNGTKTTIWTNVKKVKESTTSSDTNTNTKSNQNQSESDKSTIDLTTKEQVNQQSDKKEKNLDLETEKPNPWTAGVFAIIGIAIVVVGSVVFYFWNWKPRKKRGVPDFENPPPPPPKKLL